MSQFAEHRLTATRARNRGTEVENRKIFLLGVGAQKAGTTWLFDYLASSGHVAINHIKEYHIWDALEMVPSSRRRLITEEQAARDFGLKIRHFLQQSPENYFNYFPYIMEKQSKRITCDITPSYAALKQTTLEAIQQGFERRGVVTKAVFLIRDPVERIWSSARMKSINYTGSAEVSDAQVLAHALTDETEVRTRYNETLMRLDSVFDAARVYVGLYEEMFEPQPLSALSAFCQVPVRPDLVEKKVNLSPKAKPLGEETKMRIAQHYRAVYDFVAGRFPQAKHLWKGYTYL